MFSFTVWLLNCLSFQFSPKRKYILAKMFQKQSKFCNSEPKQFLMLTTKLQTVNNNLSFLFCKVQVSLEGAVSRPKKEYVDVKVSAVDFDL